MARAIVDGGDDTVLTPEQVTKAVEQLVRAAAPTPTVAEKLQDAVIALVNGSATQEQLKQIDAVAPVTAAQAATTAEDLQDAVVALTHGNATPEQLKVLNAPTAPAASTGATGVTGPAIVEATGESGSTGVTGITAPVTLTGPTGPVSPTGPVLPTWSAEQRSAFANFKTQLEAWGLGDLAGWATSLYQSENAPTSFNEFYLELKGQPQYRERFGNTNDARIKAGLPALSEAEIMGLESQYKKIMSAYNLPSGFYDQPSDFRQFITNDLSAAEVADRVQAANAFVKMTDPAVRQQLQQYYGIDEGALTANALDSSKGQDILNALATKATLGVAAATAGLGTKYAEQAAGVGAGTLSFEKQAQGFGQAAEAGARGDVLSNIYGGQGASAYGTGEAVTEMFGGGTAYQEQQKRLRLAQMEKNAFSGSSGVTAGSLGTTPAAGAI